MSTQRKQYSAEFEARVALEALKGLKTVNELASHPGYIRRKLRIGNIARTRGWVTFSRHDGRGGSKTRGSASPTLSTDRATQGGVGLAEKKSWTCHLMPSGS